MSDAMKIAAIESSVAKVTLQSAQGAARAGGADFGSAFKAALDGVNQSQKQAETMAQAYALNDPSVGLEETMIATSKANISFQTLVQVRNKLVSAYHDIMNMQV